MDSGLILLPQLLISRSLPSRFRPTLFSLPWTNIHVFLHLVTELWYHFVATDNRRFPYPTDNCWLTDWKFPLFLVIITPWRLEEWCALFYAQGPERCYCLPQCCWVFGCWCSPGRPLILLPTSLHSSIPFVTNSFCLLRLSDYYLLLMNQIYIPYKG